MGLGVRLGDMSPRMGSRVCSGGCTERVGRGGQAWVSGCDQRLTKIQVWIDGMTQNIHPELLATEIGDACGCDDS